MSRSARNDASRFGIILFVILCCCAWVIGSNAPFFVLLSLIPAFIIADALDRK